jgi:hypothetical protein
MEAPVFFVFEADPPGLIIKRPPQLERMTFFWYSPHHVSGGVPRIGKLVIQA